MIFEASGTLRALSFPLLALLPCLGHTQNYAPGVPDPPICLQATAPSTPPGWPDTEASDFYYVDNSDTNATDAQNPFGSRERPRLSIPEGELAAGSYVELHGGPYASAGYETIADGSASDPVWIRGADRRNPTVIRAEWIISGRHLVIENLKFDRSRKNLALVDSRAACVRYNVFAGPGDAVGNSAAVYIGAETRESKSIGNVIYRNAIHDFGDASSEQENDYHGILVAWHSERTWILENEIYKNGGDAIQVGSTNAPGDVRPRLVFIARNRMYGNRENAVDIKRAVDVIVSTNVIHDYRPTSSSEGAAVVIHNHPEHIWILDNVISNSEFGVINTGSLDAWLIGNVIYDVRNSLPEWEPESGYASGAAMHFRGNSSGGAIANTVAYYDIGLQLTQGGEDGYIVQNNIFAFRLAAAGDDIHVASGGFSGALTISHNLHYGGETPFKSSWAGRSYDSPAGLQQSTGQFGASPLDDPAFVDAEGRDFRLRASSPAIGAGAHQDVGERFRERYGIGLDRDAGAFRRGSETGPAIGAYSGAREKAPVKCGLE
jgi:hypothetical protein